MISKINLIFQNQNLNKYFNKYYIILLKGGKIDMNMTDESHCILCIVYILIRKILFLYVDIHVI